MRSPSALAAAYDARVLGAHFVLCRGSEQGPATWRRHAAKGWALYVGPDIPVLDLLLAGGGVAGWLIGHPIDLSTRTIMDGSITIPVEVTNTGSVETIDTWLHRYGGRFAAVLVDPVRTVFPDAYGALPIFHAHRSQVVASNPFLIAAHGGAAVDSALVSELRIDETAMVFGLGTTPFLGVEHLLPNHVLDLSDWQTRRTWPSAPIARSGTSGALGRIGCVLEATITAAVHAGHASMSLTAGGDTRLLLACARDVVDQLRFFTVAFPDYLGATDIRWAPRIADRFRLRHELVPWIEPSEDDLRLFMYRTGCMSGERRGRRAGPSFAQLGSKGPYLAGVLGGLFVGLELEGNDCPDAEPSATALLRRLQLPRHPELLARADRWLAHLPPLTSPQIFSLAQVELYDSAWGSAFTVGHPETATATLYPFAHRDVIQCLLSIPADERRTDVVRTGIIRSRWPELLEVPFNRLSLRVECSRRWRRAGGLAVAAAHHARRAIMQR